MNLADLIDIVGLQQDEYSLSGVTFGESGQLSVIGWSGRSGRSGSNKYYILKCVTCSQTKELFGEGCFRSLKGNLVNGQIPCGCSSRTLWSQEQYSVLCSRKAKELGYTFLGFAGEWKGNNTKIKISCEKHGEWSSGNIANMVNRGIVCPECNVDAVGARFSKSDELMIQQFHKSKLFHPDTKFWRSDRLTSQGWAVYWHVSCPECGETGEATSNNIQQGKRPCACYPNRQQECYINWAVDNHNNAVAIKFGISSNSKRRVKQQNSKSVYEIRQHAIYTFPSVASCKKAERECKQFLTCGIILKRDMPDGWTETTSVMNLEKIIEIYKAHGGVLEN